MRLPEEWVNKLFERLTIRYGREFINRWDSIGVPIEDVKNDWAMELGCFAKKPEALRFAIENLPAKAPTVNEIKALAIRCPPPVFKALPEPKPD
jgi:hypothetical protein